MSNKSDVRTSAEPQSEAEISFYSKVGFYLLLSAICMLVTSAVTQNGIWAIAGALCMVSFSLLALAEATHKERT